MQGWPNEQQPASFKYLRINSFSLNGAQSSDTFEPWNKTRQKDHHVLTNKEQMSWFMTNKVIRPVKIPYKRSFMGNQMFYEGEKVSCLVRQQFQLRIKTYIYKSPKRSKLIFFSKRNHTQSKTDRKINMNPQQLIPKQSPLANKRYVTKSLMLNKIKQKQTTVKQKYSSSRWKQSNNVTRLIKQMQKGNKQGLFDDRLKQGPQERYNHLSYRRIHNRKVLAIGYHKILTERNKVEKHRDVQ